ncbi:MAG: RNA-binding domain-containing protein [Patescibacteria group bacterium]|nr:RNA-binding domain-containing protein [Patescibacteria group bacterium]
MKYIHHIYITAYVKENDSSDSLREIISIFLPENYEKEGIKFEKEEVTIDDINKMTIIRVKISKDKHSKEFITILKEKIGEEQCSKIISEENRVDEEGALYIRLNKKELLENNKAILTDDGNCIHFKIMLAAYPKTKEKALLVVKQLFL